MRVGPSGSDCRIRVQTTASRVGPMAEGVSVAAKGGINPVRCALVRRTRVNRCCRVESVGTSPKPGSRCWPAPKLGGSLPTGRAATGMKTAGDQREALVRNGGTCRLDAKGDLQGADP